MSALHPSTINTKEQAMSTIYLSAALDKCLRLEDVVQLVNEGTFEGMEGIEFSAEQLAGQWAWRAATEGESDPASRNDIEGHLEFLSDAGATFNTESAIDHAIALESAHQAENN